MTSEDLTLVISTAEADCWIPAIDFIKRQGYITLTRDDGVTHDLSPVDDTPISMGV